LIDSDDEEALQTKKSRKINVTKKKRLRRSQVQSKNPQAQTTTNSLIDSDDDDDDDRNNYRRGVFGTSGTTTPARSMNRRDKMEYRVAKKRKLKAEKEIEIANIVRSKNWNSSGAGVTEAMARRQPRERSGMFTDSLLSRMEKKYSKDSGNGERKIKPRKKQSFPR